MNTRDCSRSVLKVSLEVWLAPLGKKMVLDAAVKI